MAARTAGVVVAFLCKAISMLPPGLLSCHDGPQHLAAQQQGSPIMQKPIIWDPTTLGNCWISSIVDVGD